MVCDSESLAILVPLRIEELASSFNPGLKRSGDYWSWSGSPPS